MTKQERADKAQAHYEDIKIRLAAETEDSIQRIIVYGPSSFLAKENEPQNPHFTLIATDSVSCLFKKVTEGKTAILNYASYKHPGGYFLGGSPRKKKPYVMKVISILSSYLSIIPTMHGIRRI